MFSRVSVLKTEKKKLTKEQTSAKQLRLVKIIEEIVFLINQHPDPIYRYRHPTCEHPYSADYRFTDK